MRRSMIFVMAGVLAAGGTSVYLASAASAATTCAPAWSATAVYVGGNSASQNGHNYNAKWWTQNESPDTHSGQWDVWADQGACSGGTTTPTTAPTTAPTTPPTTPPTTAPTSKPPTTAPTTPPTTAPTTAPTSSAPVTGIPKHAIVGYLHASFENGAGYLRVSDVPSSWDVIDLAFGEPTSVTSGDIQFNPCSATDCPGAESQAQFIADIKAKRAAGKKVLLSIGGANGEVQLTTTAARDEFVSSVSAIIDQYGLDGVDIDFESQSLSLNQGDTDFKNPTTPVIVNLISALKSLKAKYGSSFVLTMAPETFFVQLGYQYYGSGPYNGQDPRAGAFLPVIYAMRNDLTLLTVQDYNSGSIMGLDNQYHSMGGADFHIAMTDMLLSGFPVAGNTANMFPALRPDQVAFGVPASTTAGNGYVAPAGVEQAFGCLTTGTNCGGYTLHSGAHPDLRGLMTWSINWDKYNNWEFQNQDGAYVKSLP